VVVAGASAAAIVLGDAGCSSSSCGDTSSCAEPDGSTDSLLAVEASLADARQDARREGGTGDGAGDAADGGDAGDGSPPGDSGDGGADSGDTGRMCTPGATPAKGGCITATDSLFVSMGGTDKPGYGTMEKPYATVGYAASKLGKNTAIYVCNGTYSDTIVLDAAVSVYGGLTCAAGTWTYVATTFSTITGKTPSYAIEINAGSATVDVEDLQFVGLDAVVAGGSSVAVWVNETPSVTLVNVHGTGGAGRTGLLARMGIPRRTMASTPGWLRMGIMLRAPLAGAA